MAGSRQNTIGTNPWAPSPRTGGPLGTNRDAADPKTPGWFVGDSEGPLGHGDHGDPDLRAHAGRSAQQMIEAIKTAHLRAGIVRQNVNEHKAIQWISPGEEARHEEDLADRRSIARQIATADTVAEVLGIVLSFIQPEWILADLPAAGALPAATDEVLIGTSTSQMRREAAQLIRSTPDHPLGFLLDSSGEFKSSKGLSHAQLIDGPDVVQMGHIVSRKSGRTERIMLQGAWENQFNALTAERAGMGTWVQNPAIEIGGIAVDLKTATFWEEIGWLKKGTVGSARRLW